MLEVRGGEGVERKRCPQKGGNGCGAFE